MSTILPTDATTPCRTCSAPLAADQRYCLNCGVLRGEARLSPDDVAAALGHDPTTAGPGAPAPVAGVLSPAPIAAAPQDRTALAVLVIAAIVLPSFGLGLLLGGRGDDVTVPAPQVITVGAAAAPTPVAAATTVTDTWPAGKDGWTVQLQALPKAGTQPAAVQAAAADATAKGAPAVGTLDSDAHPSLPAGDHIVFSGVYDDRAAATDALAGVQDAFPDARVVRVGEATAGAAKKRKAGAAKDDEDATVVPEASSPEGLSPQEFQKRSKKLPKTTGTGGAPPPTDDKAPGGGTEEEAVTIG